MSRYLLGVYNRKTNKVVFKQVPMHNMSNIVKKRKKVEAIPETNETRTEARNRLGMEFGTRKAQKAIQEALRNKVDPREMEDMQDIIMDNVTANTSNLPTRGACLLTGCVIG